MTPITNPKKALWSLEKKEKSNGGGSRCENISAAKKKGKCRVTFMGIAGGGKKAKGSEATTLAITKILILGKSRWLTSSKKGGEGKR